MADTERVKYVEELESQEDYWLSITDAARVCRVQDVSIRRAINSGRLPVRTTNAGDNHRTRFVRASDLVRANFPILDSGAAITSEIRKVDILNIPLQQELLRQQQEAQATTLTHLQEEEEALRTEVTGRLDTLTTTTEEQHQQLAQLRQEGEQTATQLSMFQHEATKRLDGLTETLRVNQQNQATAQEQINQRLETLRTSQQETTSRLGVQTVTIEKLEKQAERIRQEQASAQATWEQAQAELQKNIASLRLDMQEQLQQALKGVRAEQQAALQVLSQEVRAEQKQFYDTLQRHIQAVERDEARDIQAVTAQQEQYAERLERIAQQTTQRSQTIEQRLAELEKRLQTEQAEHTTLTEHLARYEAAQNPSKRKGEPPA